jgi:DNA (cytosine-5)-methyltransferase 1
VTAKWAKGAGGPAGDEVQNMVAHALRGEGFDASEEGTGRGTPLVPVAFPAEPSGTQVAAAENISPALGVSHAMGIAPTLRAGGHMASHANAGVMPAVAYAIQERAVSENPDAGPDGTGVAEGIGYTLEARSQVQAVAFDLRGREGGAQFEGPHHTANLRAASGGSSRSYVAQRWAVRRLTPTECERLQGFPDGWTQIAWRGKAVAACPDGPRYKALGNSMAVPVMAWIGARLKAAMPARGAP